MDITQIKKIWDKFDRKGCTFKEFADRINGLSDPDRMRRDLDDIELRKAREVSNRIRVNRAMNG